MYEKKAAKSDNERLIMVFGDSLTYGYGDEKGSGYIDALQTKLNQKHKDEVFRYKNEGIYGLESSGILKQLSDVRISERLDEADYVLVFIGTNDLINSNGGDVNPLRSERIAAGKKVFNENLDTILELVKAENSYAPILLLRLYNPYPDEQKYERIFDQ
ncbi:GDSL-type esterase/lipase family protein [Mesobacillus zeae]|uniref:GDSL-type esterase/lipase family protein n=1 Tax=Mesobacillus zeae TaxID=1917180 RepID=UPI0015E7B6A5|nr:GDSL-type esterase/lipase family protein [Mesobacillus zeae]